MGEEYEREEYSVNILVLFGLASTDRIVRTLRSWVREELLETAAMHMSG